MGAPALNRVVDLDGPLHYREWPGPVGSRTIVCLHAVGGSHLHWPLVAPGLARHARVLALDLPGFGASPRAGRRAFLETNRRLLSRFLRTAATDDVVLAGHSMGGGLAILQAAAEPATVSALLLSSSSLPVVHGAAGDRAAFTRFIARRARMRARAVVRSRGRMPGMEQIVRDALRGAAAHPDTLDPEILDASVALAQVQPTRDMVLAFNEAARSTFSLLARGGRFRRLLDEVACPVLMVHGTRDRTVPMEFAEAAAAAHPAWRLALLDGLGHIPQLEAPGRWLDAVEPWLDGLPRS